MVVAVYERERVHAASRKESQAPHARGYSQVADTFDEAPPVTCSESPRLSSRKRVIVGPASTAFHKRREAIVVVVSRIDESRLPIGDTAIDEILFLTRNDR